MGLFFALPAVLIGFQLLQVSGDVARCRIISEFIIIHALAFIDRYGFQELIPVLMIGHYSYNTDWTAILLDFSTT